MEAFLKDKKIKIVVFILLIIVSLFFIIKSINEIKSNKYIGNNLSSPMVIAVSGKGEVKAVPDIASLNVTISKEATTTKEAQDLLNKLVTKTLNYLKKTIADKDIKSEYGGITPKYSYASRTVCISYPCPPVQSRKIIGYIATQSITIKIRKVDEVNKIRTNLADLGIKKITGPTFSIDNKTIYQDQARALAIKNAKEKALTLAKELGIKLSKITNFSENNNNFRPLTYNSIPSTSLQRTSSTNAPKLPKGENTITSNVTITYQIK